MGLSAELRLRARTLSRALEMRVAGAGRSCPGPRNQPPVFACPSRIELGTTGFSSHLWRLRGQEAPQLPAEHGHMALRFPDTDDEVRC